MRTLNRHDESTLWAYAAQELADTEVRQLEDHLDDCPDCRERLAAVQIAREALDSAREALDSAREAWPVIGWQPIDDTIGNLVEKRLAAQARRPYYLRLGLFLGGLAAAALIAVVVLSRGEASAPAPVVMSEAPPPPAPVTARVDRSSGLERTGVRDVPDGTVLLPGDELKTTRSGKAFLHLPDLSHVRLAGASSLTLSRISVDDVALTLEHGRLAVRASHQDRKGFVVYAGGLTVHVVGTIFAVTESTDGTEVAVSEGRVRVELPNDEQEFVDAGQRLRLDARGKVTRGLKLTTALGRELDEVMTVGDAASAVETNAVVSASGGRTSQPPLLQAQGTPRSLPRLTARDSRARQVELPAEAAPAGPGFDAEELAPPPPARSLAPAAAPQATTTQRLEPQTELEVEGPAEPPPSNVVTSPRYQAGSSASLARGGLAPAESARPAPETFASAPDEWIAPPGAMMASAAPAAPVQPRELKLRDEREPTMLVAPAPAPKPRAMARDLESIFMNHAELALEQGTCDRFLVGLEDIAQDAAHSARTEYARVLRARCFNVQLRPRQAVNEYRKYLEEYPRGRYGQEAAEAVGP